MKRRYKKRKYRDPVNRQTAKTLTQIGQLLETVEERLTEYSEDVGDLFGDLLAIEEALEMNFWVQLRLQVDGHLVPNAGGTLDAEEVYQMAQEYQQLYLATISVANFIRSLGAAGQEEEPIPT